ncbi:MAG: DUF3592 domain-containing protein [Imperialibacter sp.]|uniref:DUF3592 domain-containing protein n=1 Tax=Imperialibacter sp. TaxID=2038411 RepID=UPI0032EF8E4C
MNIPEATKLKIHQLIADGRKLEAVKYVKQQFGLALKDSLKLVEALEREVPLSGSSYQKRPFARTSFSGPDKVFYILSRVFLGLAVLLFTIGGTMAYDTKEELNHALQLQGRVAEFAYGSDGGSIPVVEFTHKGKKQRVQGSVASTPPAYDIGEPVKVFVIADEGYEKIRIDGIFELWIGPIILTFIGTIFLFIGGGMYAVSR